MRRHTRIMTCVMTAALTCCATATAKPAPRPTIYKPPASIKANCSVAVDAKLNAWLATVPDNSTIQFGPGRCYGQDGTITLTGRKGLIIDGQGAEFRALTPGDQPPRQLALHRRREPDRAERHGDRQRPAGHLRPVGRVAARVRRRGRPGHDADQRPGTRHVGRRHRSRQQREHPDVRRRRLEHAQRRDRRCDARAQRAPGTRRGRRRERDAAQLDHRAGRRGGASTSRPTTTARSRATSRSTTTRSARAATACSAASAFGGDAAGRRRHVHQQRPDGCRPGRPASAGRRCGSCRPTACTATATRSPATRCWRAATRSSSGA